MANSYDIFKIGPDGTAIWCAVCNRMGAAQALVGELALKDSADYRICDLTSGQTIEILNLTTQSNPEKAA